MKKGLKNLFITIALMGAMVLLFMGFLTLSNLIPRESLTKNIKESAGQVAEYQIANETVPQMYAQYKMDFYTDSVMLNTAYFTNPAHPFKSAIAAPCYGGGIADLAKVANDPLVEPNKTYSRYWHGYLVVLRPLLLLFNYIDIGVFNTYVFGFLLLAVLFVLYRRIGAWFAGIFLFAIISLNVLVLPINLQLTTVFILSFVFIIAVAGLNQKKPQWIPYAFLVFGMTTMYFDFYTYPIMTYGFPMIVLLLLNEKLAQTQMHPVKLALLCFGLWILGYATAWVAKIALASLVVGQSEAATAGYSLLSRVSRSIPESVYTKLTEGLAGMAPGLVIENMPLWLIALALVMLPMIKPVFLCLFALLLITSVLLAVFKRKKGKPKTGTTWALILVSALPILWYVVAVNPTIIHFYFQYRGIGVTLLGGFTALLVNVDFTRLGAKKDGTKAS